jgi:hypothetical protein
MLCTHDSFMVGYKVGVEFLFTIDGTQLLLFHVLNNLLMQ